MSTNESVLKFLILLLILLNLVLFIVLGGLHDQALVLENLGGGMEADKIDLIKKVVALEAEAESVSSSRTPPDPSLKLKGYTDFFQNPVLQKIGDCFLFVAIIVISKR